ncbi:MAG: glycosyl hydrolase-related protein, partial [Acidimicrobiales bacterium]
DCKYGYDIRGDVMRLSLLRALGYPDPLADMGRHRFAYALLPHIGDLRDAGVIGEAEAFNLPLAIVEGGAAARSGDGTGGRSGGRHAGSGQAVSVDRPGVSVEAVKWAERDGEDGAPGVVVRICEVWGSRSPARVTLHLPFSEVARTDLLEREISPIPHEGRTVEVSLRPFELVTLRFAIERFRTRAS